MSKYLVIVESPAKAKTINKILGSDYVVKACMGHVRDLPERKLGVDIDNGFAPEYVRIKGKSKVLTELKAAAKKAESIYLAPDPDREGEAIAWHLLAELSKDVAEEQFYRVTYNEITAAALREAFENPGRLDLRKVDSQQARRVLDRIVGYKVSPLLWRRIRGGSSAGRVQSVALRLVCEREQAINDFVAEEYWLLGASVRKQAEPVDPFVVKLARINGEKAEIKNGEMARQVQEDLEGRVLTVGSITEKVVSRKAQPPYITSTLQQAGSRFCGYTPSRTMRIAQNLYEGMDFGEGPVGLITYMRTDSFSISKQAQGECLGWIEKTYGKEYVPAKPNFYKSRGSAQEAHEAIRPTEVTRTPDSLAGHLKPDELKLYRIIWERYVASQMAPARIAQKTAEVEAAPDANHTSSYAFRTTASEIVFPGYMKVTGADRKKSAPKEGDAGSKLDETLERLPPLVEGEPLDLVEWLSEQKFTQPPGRYSEASLVRALEENGVGRPSTYAQTISTVLDRNYVEKDKRALKPTELGTKVNEFLVAHLNELFDVKFTAGMEESLDEIEKGNLDWTGMLADFHARFLDWIKNAKGPDGDPAVVRELLALGGQVQEWAPETKRGKRTYSDQKFVTSISEQLEKGEKPISERQVIALRKVVCRYHQQLPTLDEVADRLGMTSELVEARKPKEPPRETSVVKLDLLTKVKFDEPRKVGKRTYDDKAFSDSLRQQVEGGKRLTENQLRYLDRLVMKYADQIEGLEDRIEELGLDQSPDETQEDAKPILALFDHVKTWKPAVMRGKREWDDKKFFDSLANQFRMRKSLSPRQVASLKKMTKRYADQIPGYEGLVEQYGLPPPGSGKGKKKAE